MSLAHRQVNPQSNNKLNLNLTNNGNIEIYPAWHGIHPSSSSFVLSSNRKPIFMTFSAGYCSAGHITNDVCTLFLIMLCSISGGEIGDI